MAHRFYDTRLWRDVLRPAIMREQPLCVFCTQKGKTTSTQIVDHIIPHKGDWELFADKNNLQGLCKKCHDSTKQSREKLGYSSEVGVNGDFIDPLHPANKTDRYQ